jgi:hypothetical protein
LTTKEEHVAVMIHMLEVGLERISAALVWWSRTRSVMVEERMPSQSQYSTEVPIPWLIKVEGGPKEIGHVTILD